MDRERLRLLAENTRTFLLSKNSREVFVFLFFLAVSAGFWLLQTLNEDYEMEIHIPLTLKDVPTGTVITTELPEVVTVTVKDRGTTLLNYFTNRSERHIEVSFATHDRGVSYDHVQLSHSETQKLVLAQLLPSTRIISIRPDTLEYFYTRGVQKRVPVVFRGHVDTNPTYYLANIKVEPDSVTVWGSEQLLDSLESVSTVVTNITDIKEATTRTIPIAANRGTKVVPAEVQFTAEVDIYTENSVEVPIIGTNFPAGYSLRTFPSYATISFRIGAKNYKKVTKEHFVLTTTYEDLIANPDSVLTLQLRSIPEGVSQVKITPATVQYLIEQTESE